MTWIIVIFSQLKKAVHLCHFISSAWAPSLAPGERWGWRGEGASSQVCFIDQAQDGRKLVNTRVNNAWGEGRGNRDLLKWWGEFEKQHTQGFERGFLRCMQTEPTADGATETSYSCSRIGSTIFLEGGHFSLWMGFDIMDTWVQMNENSFIHAV